jgi:hypothetical protein
VKGPAAIAGEDDHVGLIPAGDASQLVCGEGIGDVFRAV